VYTENPFQFHWMDSHGRADATLSPAHRRLSIPLNGFAEVSFLLSAFADGSLSIPLNGFRNTPARLRSSTLVPTFNSIEWIHINPKLFSKLHDSVKLSFNSIEWIHWHGSIAILSGRFSNFQFHWMDSICSLSPSVRALTFFLSIPLNGF